MDPHVKTARYLTPRTISVLTLLVAITLTFIEELAPGDTRPVDSALVLFAFVAILWYTDTLYPVLARWLAGLGTAGIIFAAAFWFSPIAALPLMPLPILITAWTISGTAALLVALLTSIFIYNILPTETSVLIFALVAVWLTLVLIALLKWQIREENESRERYFWHARAALEESRNRQLELSQAMDALAHATRELKLMNQQLSYARQAAEEARNAKADFVARVSHELRTPLNMIIGFGQMLAEAQEIYGVKLPQPLLADLAVILRNSQHLSDLVDDVLELSRVESGRITLVREWVDIGELVEGAYTTVIPLFHAKELFLRCYVEPRLPAIYCDRTRIREVLVNLLSNAGRFTERGGVTVRVDKEGPSITFAVADTGPGIDKKDMRRLFQPFSQLESTLRRRHGGTGLGLAISKMFVELHGGSMWIESIAGQGTTVYFRLPIEPDTPLAQSPARWFSPLWEYRQPLVRPAIPKTDLRLRLVVQEQGTVLQTLLKKHVQNLEIIPVRTFQEAVRELEECPAQALIVNSSSVSQELRQIHRMEDQLPYDLPVILCAVPDIFEHLEDWGITDYLLKPVSREMLLDALQRLHLPHKKVLVVDDDRDVLRLFWRMLSAPGNEYQVLTASDGQQALRMMEKHRPAAVILDLVMPNMDGFKLLEERSRQPTLQQIPVIVTSAMDPGGNLVLSSSLAVTRRTGLSLSQFLTCLEGLSRLFAHTPGDDSPFPEMQDGQ